MIKIYLITSCRIDRTGSISTQEPLGQLTLAAYLIERGWDVSVYSGSIFDAYSILTERRSDDSDKKVIVGLYADYENLTAVESLAHKLKQDLAYTILVGGPQTAGLNEAFLRKNPDIDMFIRGDGENSVDAVLSVLAASDDDTLLRESLRAINGVCFIDSADGANSEGQYIDNGYSDPVEDLDKMPFVSDACMINKNDRNMLAALSGRGCPFSCSFCFEGGNSKTVRLRSVDHMMAELEERLAAHPEVKYIYFGDDTFTLKADRLTEFCLRLKELRKRYDFVWFADGHVSVILRHPEFVKMMVDAGMVRMQIGIESTCQHIIDIYNKGIKSEDLGRVLDICMDAGLIQLVGNIIIGGALETEETIRQTFETVYGLIRRSRGMFEVTSTLYSHFPGTAIYKDPQKFDLNVTDPDGLTSFGDFAIANTSSLSHERITSLRKEFIIEVMKLMKKCIREHEIDDERLIRSLYLGKRYGTTSLWQAFGLEGSVNHYYDYCVMPLLGKSYDELMAMDLGHDMGKIMGQIPLRTFFYHGQEGYTKEIPQIEGYTISPFEDDLIRYCAGKLNTGEVIDALQKGWIDKFDSVEELRRFTIEQLTKLYEKKLIYFAKYDIKDEAWQVDKKDKVKNKILLFCMQTVTASLYGVETGKIQGQYILGAILKKKGYEVKVCECVANEAESYFRQEDDGSILAVGMYIDYENRRFVKHTCNEITSKTGIPVLIGGVDARTLTREEIIESGASVVLKGEGENTLPQVVDAISRNDKSAFRQIPGIMYMDGDEFVDTGAENPPEDLDQIPFPDYSLSLRPVDGYTFFILTSRGCPNHCNFCHEGSLHTKVRFRSIPNVLEEIEGLFKTWPKFRKIIFSDDTLTLVPERVYELCDGLKKLMKKYHPLTIFCESEAWSLDKYPDLLPALLDAGVSSIQIGIESGDEDMLKIYDKHVTPDIVRRVVKRAYDLGLENMRGPILIGSPFENEEHVEHEKKFIEELITMAPGMLEMPISIISPYPQTPIGMDPGRFGYVMTDPKGDCSNTDMPGYRSETMDERTILGAYQELSLDLNKTAIRMVEEGRIPMDRLLKIMKIDPRERFKFYWHNIIQYANNNLYNYLELRARTDVDAISDIDPDKLYEMHVQRTMEMWRSVNFTGAAPMIGKYVLTPIEYNLLLLCAGKLSVRDMCDRMYEKFGFDRDRAEYDANIRKMLIDFESRYWVVAVPF